jgi:hypothetical protein
MLANPSFSMLHSAALVLDTRRILGRQLPCHNDGGASIILVPSVSEHHEGILLRLLASSRVLGNWYRVGLIAIYALCTPKQIEKHGCCST